jgi:hypothetical protein
LITPEEQIYGLVEIADSQQKTTERLLEKLNLGLSQLDDTRQLLARTVSEAAQRGVGDALAQAPAATAKTLQSSARTLDEATQNARSASRHLGWQTVGIVALGCLTAVIGVLSVGWYITPTPEEITALRAEKRALEVALDDLERRGGRIKLNQCGAKNSRLCAEVDETAGSFGEGGRKYRVLKGY